MNLSFEDKEYWAKYYDSWNKTVQEPSPFAVFLEAEGYIANKLVVELGCGNGRDAVFFSETAQHVDAVDLCESTTSFLDGFDKISGHASDFTRLPERATQVDLAYSRFTLHAVDEESEDRTLTWIFHNLNEGGVFCCEARTIHDDLYGKGIDKGNDVWYYNDHHRRFMRSKAFLEKLKSMNFEILFSKESKGFAVYKGEDPVVFSVIAKKRPATKKSN